MAEALIELLAEGGAPPTAKIVAERAGVSVRLVFHHFQDMDALYRMVASIQLDRHWRSVRPVPPDLPLDERIERTVLQRAKLFDAISPVRRTAIGIAPRVPAIARGLAISNKLLSGWVEETFAPELPPGGRDRRELVSAIAAASSWEVWNRLRHGDGLSAPATRRVVARMLRALVAG